MLNCMYKICIGLWHFVPDFTRAEGQSFWMQGRRHSWLLRGLYFVKVTARAAILPLLLLVFLSQLLWELVSARHDSTGLCLENSVCICTAFGVRDRLCIKLDFSQYPSFAANSTQDYFKQSHSCASVLKESERNPITCRNSLTSCLYCIHTLTAPSKVSSGKAQAGFFSATACLSSSPCLSRIHS